MNIQLLEQLMYELTDLFLAPVLILLVILMGYSLYVSGVCFFQTLQRRAARPRVAKLSSHNDLAELPESLLRGHPLLAMTKAQPELSQDELDVAALKEMEGVRNVSRLAPMLGLIATMVPMGPALKSLADGNIQGISENLIVAFSAVIFGLVIASITFWIASVKKRWLASELVLISHLKSQQDRTQKKVDIHEAA
ncbi:MotA/TolQ/ExbB proton channel family protein [Pleionea sp. CnH1-48]|uniref:MotA/TolQ/ExbB proton channel family protein n=1 Tax=Pleionea sp. CnH1-48 TaxID=2954494 RepID=UPI002096F6F9|nr:MotA/TolQ/ExbB proton channel family protein [Pleionea sp. CnH1-48]MCO7222956.1 MotA/TolQ/ExbB proton channel family protein [Pleionea sp. CnH1-48]